MSQISLQNTLWNTVKDEFRSLFPRDVFDTWFESIECVEDSDTTLVLGAPNEFSLYWLEDNYLDLIRQKAHLATGRPVDVSIRVQPVEEEVQKAAEEAVTNRAIIGQTSQGRFRTYREPGSNRRPQSRSEGWEQRSLVLNPRNTFQNFIVGPSNQLAHAASLAVAKSPGRAYNPLFLYGETGLGKTHLMHAIAQNILQQDPDAHVVYVSCEKFTNEFMRAIQENTLSQFRRFYRNVDILLIDDIHFLTGKERTQEEFFHTFNELFESQRQLCLSSDRPASEIARLESRLVSRFQWGMVTDIQAPDLETRVAILGKKAAAQNYNIPAEVLQFLGQRITRNVRRMEGALTRVASYGNLIHQPLDIATVERLLHDVLQEESQNQLTIEKIQRRVAEHYDIRMSDMSSRRRPTHIAFPRQVAMYLCRLLTNHSLQEIGDEFGKRDHGTVIHACKTVENLADMDHSVKRSVDFLKKQLAGQNN